jgi:plastocyanin
VSGARRRAIVLLAAAVAAASMLMLAFGGGASARLTPKVVQVKDDLFTPVNVGLLKGGSVKWKWVNTIHTHNVRLQTAPAGVVKSNFNSQNSSSPTYTFTRKFTKLGKYHFICSIHPSKMQMNVNVHN